MLNTDFFYGSDDESHIVGISRREQLIYLCHGHNYAGNS
jgi:hypothetical protein